MPTILIIDDRQDNLLSVSALLKSMITGCRVITSLSGEEGIKKATANKPDTILLDLHMPGMDGFETCKLLKSDPETKHIPIILLTAVNTDSDSRVKGLEIGADAFLAKPVDRFELAAQVKAMLRIKSAEDRLRQERDKLKDTVRMTSHELKESFKRKKALEAQLQQAQKMEAIGTLAGGIAHDFNNILYPIIGYTEMMLFDTPKGSERYRTLNEILSASFRARDLVQQILTFSRQAEKQLKPLKAQIIIREILKLMKATLPATITINQNIDNTCGMVFADPTHIHQIVMNLMTNAFHAMEEDGGILTIELAQVKISIENQKEFDLDPGSYVRLSVSDTGHGIHSQILDRIFDPYFTTKEEGKGTGLGLSVVHGIVKSYRGDIRVYTEPGKGTTFHVYLPVIGVAKEDAKSDIDHKPLQGGDEHILLVDDEEPILMMEKQMLERLGYHVTSKTSSLAALETFHASSDKFDLIITDMTMPNMTGEKLACQLKQIKKEVPVILCTGFSEKISKEKAKALGIDGFLLKPIVTSELSQTVRSVLDGEKDDGA